MCRVWLQYKMKGKYYPFIITPQKSFTANSSFAESKEMSLQLLWAVFIVWGRPFDLRCIMRHRSSRDVVHYKKADHYLSFSFYLILLNWEELRTERHIHQSAAMRGRATPLLTLASGGVAWGVPNQVVDTTLIFPHSIILLGLDLLPPLSPDLKWSNKWMLYFAVLMWSQVKW